ncbi:hypothetical protein MCAMS1_00970 [biofilm metagenome]
MPVKTVTPLESDKKNRLLAIFENLLPLIGGLTNKLRLLWILGLLISVWFVVWCFYLKHFSLGITVFAGFAALLPTLILLRFWWALEELKNLPDIAGEMAGDAKNELQESMQNIRRTGKIPKLSFFSAGKSLWSIGAMASEASELIGSYISVAILANPIMLVLGVLSFVGVFVLFAVGIVLVFLV